MDQPLRLRWLLRSLVILPWALPTIVNALMWRWIDHAEYGALNALLYQSGLIDGYQQWLSNPATAMGMVILFFYALVMTQTNAALAAARLARAPGARVLAITAGAASPLAAAADVVLHTPCGEEGGAATKSDLAALAALAAVAGAIPMDGDTAQELRRDLERIVADPLPAVAVGRLRADVRCAWVVGYGTAAGVAQAAALLLQEKALMPAVTSTPSELRHGPIEAITPGDAVLAVELDTPNDPRSAYLEQLATELAGGSGD